MAQVSKTKSCLTNYTAFYRLSTLWHFIAYIDVDAEKILAETAIEERNRQLENNRKKRNQQAEAEDALSPDDVSIIVS